MCSKNKRNQLNSKALLPDQDTQNVARSKYALDLRYYRNKISLRYESQRVKILV